MNGWFIERDFSIVYLKAPLFKRISNMRKRGDTFFNILKRLYNDKIFIKFEKGNSKNMNKNLSSHTQFICHNCGALNYYNEWKNITCAYCGTNDNIEILGNIHNILCNNKIYIFKTEITRKLFNSTIDFLESHISIYKIKVFINNKETRKFKNEWNYGIHTVKFYKKLCKGNIVKIMYKLGMIRYSY